MSEILNDLEDDSFVVLESSPSNEVSEYFNNHSCNEDFANLSLSSLDPQGKITNIINDLQMVKSLTKSSSSSYFDLEEKIQSLTADNYRLRETLKENNIDIKKRLEDLVTWHDDILKTHRLNNEKFTETKKHLIKLKEENEQLKKENEQLTKENEQLKKENKQLEQENTEKSNITNGDIINNTCMHCQDNFDENIGLKNTNKLLQETYKKLTSELGQMKSQNYTLSKKITDLENDKLEMRQMIDDNNDLKNEIIRLQNDKSELQIQIADYQCKLRENENFRIEQANFKQENSILINNLNTEINELKSKIKNVLASKERFSSFPNVGHLNNSEKNKIYVENINIYNNILENLNNKLTSYWNRYNVIHNDLFDYLNYLKAKKLDLLSQEDTNKISITIQSLDIFLNEEVNFIPQIESKTEPINIMFGNYSNILNDLINEQKENYSLNTKIEQQKNEIEKLEIVLKEKELTSSEALANYISIEEQEKQLHERIDILTVQLDVYKTDFEAERKARSELAAKNQSLTEMVNKHQSTSENSPLDMEFINREETTIHYCPLCRSTFRTFTLLQDHVEFCMEN